ncbi:HpcH/HpaI aldolase/citrate lyase family protein [Microbulbifer sp. HZ11]|uniref:HpcH/HpaI aldolase family protein n=1 Tax=Microbulbifer sp. HZ11 TaxID=1453501 RepID=UPI0005B99080|nr:aldolase/citrate lyase family protein [Microbulbifer sp. HZ11]
MLQKNSAKEKMLRRQEVYGILNSVPSPLVCEMIGAAGYDFIILDTEHLLVNPAELQHCIRAAESFNITPLVRVPSSDNALIARALDAGAQGIVIPRVSSVAQARTAIEAVRFPPRGRRGITGGRNTGFGALNLDEYMARADREVLLVLMIEDPEGVSALPEILTLGGIDMILEGALDLSIAMGHGSQVQHASVQAALQTMAGACFEAGIPFCAIPRQPAQLDAWREMGVHTFVTGEDRGILFRQLKAHLNDFKSPASARSP